MRAPEHEPGTHHGNRIVCAGCGAVLEPRRGSRRQKFCSYTCRDAARRERNFLATGCSRRADRGTGNAIPEGARYCPTAVPRSVENTPTKSTASKGDFGDRGSTFNALPVVAIGLGLGISTNAVGAIDAHPQADLIRRAIRLELAARWRRGGLR
jgi:hypothetical protein